MNTNRADAGFTLLEVIVAFAILSLALGMLVQGFASGYRNIRIAKDQMAALDVARSLITETGIVRPLQQGQFTGSTDSGLFWVLDIAPYRIDAKPATAKAYWVRVTVKSMSDKTVMLESIKLQK